MTGRVEEIASDKGISRSLRGRPSTYHKTAAIEDGVMKFPKTTVIHDRADGGHQLMKFPPPP